MPSASAWRSCTNCAGASAAAAERSTCLLLYKPPLGETAKARLAIMRETEDGFRIAEEDLKLRGEGDVLGTRQSGMPGFRSRAHRGPRQADRRGARRCLAGAGARSHARLRARRGAAASALSVRARRGDPADPGGVSREQDCLVVACTVEHVDDMVCVDPIEDEVVAVHGPAQASGLGVLPRARHCSRPGAPAISFRAA